MVASKPDFSAVRDGGDAGTVDSLTDSQQQAFSVAGFPANLPTRTNASLCATEGLAPLRQAVMDFDTVPGNGGGNRRLREHATAEAIPQPMFDLAPAAPANS
jgi:hypothetical protein